MKCVSVMTAVIVGLCVCDGVVGDTEHHTSKKVYQSYKKRHHGRALPCPDASEILPCICTVLPEYEMDIDCSAVTSSDDLARVFNVDMPFLDFNTLIISNNDYLTDIRFGDFGKATFKRITITNTALQAVIDGAFSGSYNTLMDLDIVSTQLNYFPYHEISQFTQLKLLNFGDNSISSFPELSSTSLSILIFDSNPLGTISESALKNLPALTSVSLIGAQLNYIPPGTFVGLSLLEEVHLEVNELVSLAAGAINMVTPNNLVHLHANNLVTIAVDALAGVNGDVNVEGNQLTELAEDVWKPLMDDGISLFAARNPLTCGCEIAWLVLNTYYLNALADDVTCTDGELVADLDPGIYIHC